MGETAVSTPMPRQLPYAVAPASRSTKSAVAEGMVMVSTRVAALRGAISPRLKARLLPFWSAGSEAACKPVWALVVWSANCAPRTVLGSAAKLAALMAARVSVMVSPGAASGRMVGARVLRRV